MDTKDHQVRAEESSPDKKRGLQAGDALRAKFKNASLWNRITHSPLQLWQSKINGRIATTVFLTMLLVQLAIMSVTLRNFEDGKLLDLREAGRIHITASLSNTRDQLVSPLSGLAAEEMLMRTFIKSITVYNLAQDVVQTYGGPTLLKPGMQKTGIIGYQPASKTHFETVYTPTELRLPYYVAVRMDATSLNQAVTDHIMRSVVIMLLISAFVTSVLMLALGEWLLHPITVLRNNLLNAAKQPERPQIQQPRRETKDEIGIAIRIANDLIRQNAQNLKKLRAQAEDKIHKLAYYDNLTGLPNRTFFIEKLEENIKRKVMEEDGRLAVFSLDIDHFKDINDTMGHEFGDKLLEAISKRLVKALPEDSLIARASADEFSIMVLLKPEHPDSAILVDGLFNAVLEPVSIMHERFQVRVSLGVSHCPDDGTEARQIMKNADVALNRAKEEGRDTVRYYSEDFDLAVKQRFQMLRDLRTALDQDQLELHYHPQFDLKTGQLIGAEALLRWWHPDASKEGGYYVPPAEFVPVAEQSGLIVPIGEWVLKTACETNKKWQDMGLPPFRIAVNISGVQFHRADIINQVASALKDTGLDPKLLELEVTESVFMEDMDKAIDILNQLHRFGVELAIDDFGTGYSSLSYLRQFPIDRLKIDQSFIKNALSNPDDSTIARTIINLGHSLNLKVIAEGVETIEHEDFLREHGCDEVQGFKYTRPIPAEQFRDFIIAYNRNLARHHKLTAVADDRA